MKEWPASVLVDVTRAIKHCFDTEFDGLMMSEVMAEVLADEALAVVLDFAPGDDDA